MKNSILMVTPEFDKGGTEVYILNLTRYLIQREYFVKVICGPGERVNVLEKHNLEHKVINELKFKGVINLLKSTLKIRKEVKKYNTNIIHSSSLYTMIISKLATLTLIRKVKTVYTMHGGPNQNIENTNSILFNYFVDEVIALSETAKSLLINSGVKEDKITVIYNGIYERFDPSKEELCNKNHSKTIITTCGRLTKQKGHEYLINAIEKLKNENIEVWIIGEGELRETLMKYSKELGVENRIKFLGFKEDVYSYLLQTDIFVLPSLWEQFPISILEAMMVGLPIVASNVNGIPEELGNCGILVEPGNSSALAQCLNDLIQDKNLRLALGNDSRKRFKDLFTVETMGESTIKVYEKTKK